jgi:unsaturated rhamnogalacturonyl hydrolase
VAQSPEKPFFLHDGDTVVFYGDSITEQRYYTQWVETYVATRFPHMLVHFYSVGNGGDTVHGGSAGPIDLRLNRDVLPLKPTVVVIMLGMNDGGYGRLTEKIENTYRAGYEHILNALQQALPKVRFCLLGASPYDEITRPPKFEGGYNPTLVRFGQINRELAEEHKGIFVDLNAPFVAALKRGVAVDPLATEILLPDRVHPEQLIQRVMAQAIIKGWNGPAIASYTSIDAGKGLVSHTIRSHVSNLTSERGRISWTELDDALPLPLDDTNVGTHFLREISPIEDELDRQPLKVEGLEPGTYQLAIDGGAAGKYSDSQLAEGINLTDGVTLMVSQAYRVGWEVRDREETHYVRQRMFRSQFKSGVSPEPGASDLLKFEEVQQHEIEEEAQPLAHKFELRLLTGRAMATQQSANEQTPGLGDSPEDAGPMASHLSTALKKKDIASILRKVGDWQLNRVQEHESQDWTFAALYAGFMALPPEVHGDSYQKAMFAMGDHFDWRLGPRQEHADDQAVGQTYLELYEKIHRQQMLTPTRDSMDILLKHTDDTAKPLWWWCDALFMAPPVLADLSAITSNSKYLDFMDREWWITSNLLYDSHLHLYSRDMTFLSKREANGAKVFWSRGNGWVMAGLVRVLKAMPADYKDRQRYVAQLREMSQATAAVQGADGLWRPGLLDAEAYPLPEVSGSAFITYAITWGVNNGVLDRAEYEPIIRKAWAGLLGHVYEDGRLGCIQPIGAAPGQFTATSTYVFGVGAFLLAGSEIYKLSPA